MTQSILESIRPFAYVMATGMLGCRPHGPKLDLKLNPVLAGRHARVLTEAPAPRSTGAELIVADFDGDGALDLFEVRGSPHSTGAITLHCAVGSPQQASLVIAAGHPYQHVALGDLDGNGTLEVVAGYVESKESYDDGGIEIHRLAKSGSGLCQFEVERLAVLPVKGSVVDLALGDLDDDGDLDLAAAIVKGKSRKDPLSQTIWYSTSASAGPTFVGRESTHLVAGASVVEIFDVDGDGRTEAVIGGFSVFASTLAQESSAFPKAWGVALDSSRERLIMMDSKRPWHPMDLELVPGDELRIAMSSSDHASPGRDRSIVQVFAFESSPAGIRMSETWSTRNHHAGSFSAIEVARLGSTPDDPIDLLVARFNGTRTLREGDLLVVEGVPGSFEDPAGIDREFKGSFFSYALSSADLDGRDTTPRTVERDAPAPGKTLIELDGPSAHVPTVECPDRTPADIRYAIGAHHLVLARPCPSRGRLKVTVREQSAVDILYFGSAEGPVMALERRR